MTMMDCALLERRREINRKAARKSRSRQKELSNQIKKKYYEAQSSHTKLIYERNRLVRERDELKTKLQNHRHSCSRSSEPHFDLLDVDPPRSIQTQPRRSTSHQMTPCGPSSLLSRRFSWPESSVTRFSQPHWPENVEADIEISSTSSAEEEEEEEIDEEEEQEQREEEQEEEEDPPSDTFSPGDWTFKELGIPETNLDGTDSYTLNMSLITDQLPLGIHNFEEQTDFLGCEGNSLSLLDGFPLSSAAQIFDESITCDFPTFSISSGNIDFTTTSGLDSSQSSSTATIDEMSDISGSYYDDQQSEAIDLSKPRAPLSTTYPTSVPTTSSVNCQNFEEKVFILQNTEVFPGNIPLHVQNFVVGEK